MFRENLIEGPPDETSRSLSVELTKPNAAYKYGGLIETLTTNAHKMGRKID